MDEDPLPSSVHATTVPDSPIFDPRVNALKSSSPPPLFSENDSLDTADVTNYESPREKRKRAGTWWQTGPRGAPKRRQFNRNFDSGVYMMSDDSEVSVPASSALSHLGFHDSPDIPSDPPVPEHTEQQDEGFEHKTRSMGDCEARFYRAIHCGLDSNKLYYNFAGFDIWDHQLHHLHMLNQIVTVPPDVDIEVPAEGQYRSMIPEIQLNISSNNLRRLSPTLFQLQYLTSLTLRHNSIQRLPPQIKQLTNLSRLDLCYNSITALPCELLSLCAPQGKLVSVSLAGNPLVKVSCFSIVEYRKTKSTLTEDYYKDMSLAERYSSLYHQAQDQSSALLQSSLAGMLRYAEVERNEIKDHHGYSQYNRTPFPGLLLISATTAAYYDRTGRLLQNSPCLPRRVSCGNSRVHPQTALMTHTSLGTDGVPDVWFDRPSSSRVPSLATLSVVKAFQTEPDRVREEVGYYVDGSVPPFVEAALEKAEENEALRFKPLRSCHSCGRDYIVPRAEWLEGWVFQQEVIPIKIAVCSWGCVPDSVAMRPKPLKWLDSPGVGFSWL